MVRAVPKTASFRAWVITTTPTVAVLPLMRTISRCPVPEFPQRHFRQRALLRLRPGAGALLCDRQQPGRNRQSWLLQAMGDQPHQLQAVWLQAQLAASTAPWKIVYMHHPPYSSSSNHGSETEMQWPYEAWGATAVFAGHDHVYERIIRADGNGDGNDFAYFTTGAGGRSLYVLAPQLDGKPGKMRFRWCQ